MAKVMDGGVCGVKRCCERAARRSSFGVRGAHCVVPVVERVRQHLQLVCACLTRVTRVKSGRERRRGDSHVECAAFHCAVGFEHCALHASIRIELRGDKSARGVSKFGQHGGERQATMSVKEKGIAMKQRDGRTQNKIAGASAVMIERNQHNRDDENKNKNKNKLTRRALTKPSVLA